MTHCSSRPPQPKLISPALGRCMAAVIAALFTYFVANRSAHAVPSFARKYKTSCVTCHTVFPKLNSFGEAFRRDGYRFPSKDGSLDSDNAQAEPLPLGQEEYKKLFPYTVWPDWLTEGVPLSVMVAAGSAVNLPNSTAHDDAGNTFAWNDFVGEAAFFGAGSFNDTLTYFTELTAEEGGIGVEHAFLSWNDIVGPPHVFNLSIGRLSPTLTSWGMHSTYVADMLLPAVSVGSLYNAAAPEEAAIGMAMGHPDGVELNGVAGHRVDYSLGWVASGASDGVDTPNSQDAYAHVGFKVGGVSLDGEGPSGVEVADPRMPWSETAFALDVFGYHGRVQLDNGTSADPESPLSQKDAINVLGGVARVDLGAFSLIGGAMVERHTAPYAGTPGDPGPPPVDGTADRKAGTALVQFNELDVIIFPWLVPALRSEWTRVTIDAANGGGSANVLRIQPGLDVLVRANIKVALAAEIDRAKGAPPSQTWEPAGAVIEAQPSGESKLEAEQITGSLTFAF